MSDPPLACTVRDCGLLLVRQDARWACARGHSFDAARAGYVNLLQPQDRRSTHAGDSKDAIDARAVLLAGGVGRSILEGIAARAQALPLPPTPTIVDLGSGSGELLAMLAPGGNGIGIDLSIPAAERAAAGFPTMTWVVANADRRLPVLDRSAHLVVSVNGRRNPGDCARILTTDGFLMVALPAADDLVELREAVQGARVERDRAAAVAIEHADGFSLVDRVTLRERHALDRDALLALLRSTYRGARHSASDRLQSLDRIAVTLATDLLVLAVDRRRRRDAADTGGAGV